MTLVWIYGAVTGEISRCDNFDIFNSGLYKQNSPTLHVNIYVAFLQDQNVVYSCHPSDKLLQLPKILW